MPRKSAAGPRRAASSKKTLLRFGSLERRLRDAVTLADVATALTAPLKRSIENVLRLAAHSLGSDEASVLVRDGRGGGLKFMVAIGEVADKLLRMKLPAGKGIAGFVFSSGQPVIAGDVTHDESFYPEVDRTTGYSTQMILATPLRVDGEVVGVLEIVNRRGKPPYAPFSSAEMDTAALFADALATLVDAHETAGLIESLFARSLAAGKSETRGKRRAAEGTAPTPAELRTWLRRLRSAPEHRDLLETAVSLREIMGRGDAEREMCRGVLEVLERYMTATSPTGGAYIEF